MFKTKLSYVAQEVEKFYLNYEPHLPEFIRMCACGKVYEIFVECRLMLFFTGMNNDIIEWKIASISKRNKIAEIHREKYKQYEYLRPYMIYSIFHQYSKLKPLSELTPEDKTILIEMLKYTFIPIEWIGDEEDQEIYRKLISYRMG